jgi:hypothetical protein
MVSVEAKALDLMAPPVTSSQASATAAAVGEGRVCKVRKRPVVSRRNREADHVISRSILSSSGGTPAALRVFFSRRSVAMWARIAVSLDRLVSSSLFTDAMESSSSSMCFLQSSRSAGGGVQQAQQHPNRRASIRRVPDLRRRADVIAMPSPQSFPAAGRSPSAAPADPIRSSTEIAKTRASARPGTGDRYGANSYRSPPAHRGRTGWRWDGADAARRRPERAIDIGSRVHSWRFAMTAPLGAAAPVHAAACRGAALQALRRNQ